MPNYAEIRNKIFSLKHEKAIEFQKKLNLLQSMNAKEKTKAFNEMLQELKKYLKQNKPVESLERSELATLIKSIRALKEISTKKVKEEELKIKKIREEFFKIKGNDSKLSKANFLSAVKKFLKVKSKIEEIMDLISLHELNKLNEIKDKELQKKIKFLAEILGMPLIDFYELSKQEKKELLEKAEKEKKELDEKLRIFDEKKDYYSLIKRNYYVMLINRLR